MKLRVSVFGSINMDLVANVNRFPNPGETLKGKDFARVPGGKGANQAVAASRLGGDVSMFGLVGEDGFGDELLENLKKDEIDTGFMDTRKGPTGLALIQVDDAGENQIVIIPGANGKVDRDYVDSNLESISDTEVLLLQLEIPFETTAYLLEQLEKAEAGSPIIVLDPAPAKDLSQLNLSAVDYLIPNEGEVKQLVPGAAGGELESELFDRGIQGLVITRGEKGSSFISENEKFDVPGFSVDVADTTAAGDAFAAAFAVELSRGSGMKECLEIANAAGGIAASQEGAQPSLPKRKNVIEIINKRLSENNFSGGEA